jgi:hypothetical protein
LHDIVLNVYGPTDEKTDDMKDGFYEELEKVFDKFHIKILLEDFKAKLGRKDIFKPITRN